MQPFVEEAQEALVPRLHEDVHLITGVGQPTKEGLAQDHVAKAVQRQHQAAAGSGEGPCVVGRWHSGRAGRA